MALICSDRIMKDKTPSHVLRIRDDAILTLTSLDEPFFEELSKLADCADVHFMRNIHHPRSISISHAGDPIYHVAQLEDGQFAYGESTRNERIFFSFFSPDLDLVTRWFIYQAGEAFRVRADCASMYFPCYTYEQRPGYELVEVEKYTYALKTPAGQVLPFRMHDDLINDYSDTVLFSYICDIPVRDLLDSFLDPDGRPALEAFVVEE